MMEKGWKITVAGTGYVGLSMAILLAQYNAVCAIDIDERKVNLINNRKSPIADKEIETYLMEKDLNLFATLDEKEAYSSADFVIIATPTNYDVQTKHFDTTAVESVIKTVRQYNQKAILVIKSTVDWLYRKIIDKYK